MKYHWIKVKWQLSFEELRDALLQEPYTEKEGRGFKLDKAINGFLSGRYIIKQTYKEELITPLGLQEVFDRVRYLMYEFEINMENPFSLVLINPPRSIMEFGSALGRVTDHRVVFHSLKFDLIHWVNIIQEDLGNFSIRKLNIINIPFDAGVKASMLLRGTGKLIDLLKKHPNTSKGKITKAEFSFRDEQGVHRASITNQRVLVCDDDIATFLKPIVYKSLQE